METVLIAGGTGFIGKALTVLLLQQGYHVIILTRNKIEAVDNWELSKAQITGYKNLSFAEWNVKAQTIDMAAIREADYIVHLAGAGVSEKRWTKKRKKEIVDSRVESSRLLVKALKENANKVKAVVSASAIGWYGPDPVIPNQHPFVETDKVSNDYLGNTCLEWENSIDSVTEMNIRLVKLRTGIVLSGDGGALVEFKKPLRLGLATILGTGSQRVSWIHMDDLCRIYMFALQNDNMQGVYNAVASVPVSNKTLIETIAKKQRGRFFIPIYVPSFILKIVLGEMSIEVLKSATVSNEKIKNIGFQFIHPNIATTVS